LGFFGKQSQIEFFDILSRNMTEKVNNCLIERLYVNKWHKNGVRNGTGLVRVKEVALTSNWLGVTRVTRLFLKDNESTKHYD